MTATGWFILIGLLLVTLALVGGWMRRAPVTTAMVYLAVGLALGPRGLAALRLDAYDHALILERVAEVAVIVSLFTAGLKLPSPLKDPRWWLPVRLGFASMALTVGLVTAIGVFLLDLPLGAAVLLGAVLAPTDPVLASDVQVRHARDQDPLRFALTGEAGLNDGTAFPFIMLGLGLLGLHDVGAHGWRWALVDVLWAIAGGIAIGWLLGTLLGSLVLYLRKRHQEALGLDEFLTLGLIALSYGIALYAHTYGFLAVFAAGLSLHRMQEKAGADHPPGAAGAGAREDAGGAELRVHDPRDATEPGTAAGHMMHSLLTINEQIERILEMGVVLLLGAALTPAYVTPDAIWFVPLMLLVVRPLSVLLGLAGSPVRWSHQGYLSWLGMRGVGSIYYLMYALNQGVPADTAQRLIALSFSVVAASILLHGLTATPLMRLYGRRRDG